MIRVTIFLGSLFILINCQSQQNISKQLIDSIDPTNFEIISNQTNLKSKENASESGKVINGQPVTIESYPFMANLGFMNSTSYRFICGASIANENTVISARHCVENLGTNYNHTEYYETNGKLLVIIAGTSFINSSKVLKSLKSGQVYIIDKIDFTSQDDISLLTLLEPLTYSNQIGPVGLPNKSDETLINEKRVTIIGWGVTETGQISQELRAAESDVLNGNAFLVFLFCEGYQNENYCIKDLTVTQANVCFGDSGGPLLYKQNDKWTTYGVTSFGSATPTGQCINSLPSFYAKLPPSWALQKLQTK
ncbi:unnamed protein product [Brachionus calyciflorus]|uniref:Peptidase S1 domain-containing protein n=1 Tax=Brachionus calyciflorus TaxID=104777 RepID=A0A814KY24_9BILA|nr:unnamed protein product [Brachionus calyciflorus]